MPGGLRARVLAGGDGPDDSEEVRSGDEVLAASDGIGKGHLTSRDEAQSTWRRAKGEVNVEDVEVVGVRTRDGEDGLWSLTGHSPRRQRIHGRQDRASHPKLIDIGVAYMSGRTVLSLMAKASNHA